MINEKYAKKFCCDDISKIENYEKAMADTTQTWICHHKTEIWWNCSRKDLIENECYYNRKACELIFLTRSEHMSLHGDNRREETRKKLSEANKGRTHCAATRRKMSESHKGKTPLNKGKPMSDEQKRKLSEARKAYWAKRKAAAEGGV